MATLKDIEFSRNGEPGELSKKLGKEASGVVVYDPKNPVPEKEFYIFKLVDNSKNGGVYIPNIDDVVNPATGAVERIRLLSGVQTIWQKEQKDLTIDYVRQNMRSIDFPRGVKIRRVAAHDKTMLDFMRMSNSNIGNPKRVGSSKFEFYEYDTAAAEKEQYAKEEFELEMALEAKAAKPEEMRKHASFLGIRMINDIGEKKSDDGVRREYVMYAKRNPDYFKKTKGSVQIEMSWLIKKAISESLIDVGREPGRIFWAKDGGMICTYPQGVNAETHLQELSMMNTEEGNKFKELLKQIVK